MNLQTQMKQAVAQAAVDQIKNGMILGLGSGSTAALMIEALALKIKEYHLNLCLQSQKLTLQLMEQMK